MAPRLGSPYYTARGSGPLPIDESVTNAPTVTTPPEIADTPRGATPFVEGLLAVAVASVLSWYLRDELLATRLLLFWVASAFAAWRGGLWPALVASLLGVVLANFTTTQPLGSFARPTTSEVFSAGVF